MHTSHSADGRLDPSEIARRCRERGLAFAAISDHVEDLNADSTMALVRACEESSGDDFVLISGIEHRFRRGVHILALGQSRLVDGPQMEAFQILSGEGCVLVAAHCTPHDDLPASLLEMLSAVEIWNVGRHTRFLPVSGCLSAYRKWADKRPKLFAIGGLDMHVGGEWGCEVVLDGTCELSPQGVLGALRAGRFMTQGRLVSFGSRPARGIGEVAFAAGDALAGVRNIRNRVLYRGQYAKQ